MSQMPKTVPHPSRLESLPVDVLLLIFSYIHRKASDLLNLSATGRTLRCLIHNGFISHMTSHLLVLSVSRFSTPLKRMALLNVAEQDWMWRRVRESVVADFDARYIPRMAMTPSGLHAVAYGHFIRVFGSGVAARGTGADFIMSEVPFSKGATIDVASGSRKDRGSLAASEITALAITTALSDVAIWSGTVGGTVQRWDQSQGCVVKSQRNRNRNNDAVRRHRPTLSVTAHPGHVVRSLLPIGQNGFISAGTDSRLVLHTASPTNGSAPDIQVALPSRPWQLMSLQSSIVGSAPQTIVVALTKNTPSDPDTISYTLHPSGALVPQSTTPNAFHRASVYALASPSPHSPLYISGSYDGDCHIIDTRLPSTSMCVRSLEDPADDSPIYSLAWDGYRCAAGSGRHGLVKIWDLRYHAPRSSVRRSKDKLDPIRHQRKAAANSEKSSTVAIDRGVWWLYLGRAGTGKGRMSVSSSPVYSVALGLDALRGATDSGVFEARISAS